MKNIKIYTVPVNYKYCASFECEDCDEVYIVGWNNKKLSKKHLKEKFFNLSKWTIVKDTKYVFIMSAHEKVDIEKIVCNHCKLQYLLK